MAFKNNGVAKASRRFWLLCGGLIIVAGPQAQAQAQTSETGSAVDQANQPQDANDIVVTARKVDETLQQVPIAITALTSDGLTARNIRSLDALAATVPNFQFDTGAAVSASTFATTAFIRGVGQNDYAVFTEPGIGLYVDGVYYARSVGAALDNFEIARVEVLRGPQGTLFGKNTIGGAINVITQKPGDQMGGYAEAATGSFRKGFFQGAINIPVSDTLKTRLAAGYFRQNGYTRRLIDNIHQGNKNNLLFRGSAVYTPSVNFSVTVTGDYTHGKSNGAPVTLGGVQSTGFLLTLFNQLVAPNQGIVAPNGVRTYNSSFVTGDPYTTYGSANVRNRLTTYGFSANAELDLGPAQLRSITAYRSLKIFFARDGDASPFHFRENAQLETSKQFSQEFQLTGKGFDNSLSWLVGGYFFNEKGYDKTNLVLAGGLFEALEALPARLANGYGGRGNPLNVTLDNSDLDITHLRNRTYAVFANASFRVTDWLTLEGGVRQNWDRKTFDPVYIRVASNVYIAPPGSHYNASFNSFTPRLGVRLQASDDLNAYASYSKGFKSGGFNARPLASINEINQYQPETVGSYEAGIKSRWFDRRLVINVAAFTSNYKNIQLPVNQPPQNFVYNAGAGRIRGIEGETTARLGRGFSFNGSLGYLDAKYTKIGQNVGPGQFIPITLDSHFIKTPKFVWSAGGEYALPVSGGGQFALRTDYSHKSGYFNDVANSPQIFQKPFGLLGARLSYTAPDKRYEVAVAGTNLTDTQYLIAGNVAGASLGALVERSFSPPREVEVSFRYNF